MSVFTAAAFRDDSNRLVLPLCCDCLWVWYPKNGFRGMRLKPLGPDVSRPIFCTIRTRGAGSVGVPPAQLPPPAGPPAAVYGFELERIDSRRPRPWSSSSSSRRPFADLDGRGVIASVGMSLCMASGPSRGVEEHSFFDTWTRKYASGHHT